MAVRKLALVMLAAAAGGLGRSPAQPLPASRIQVLWRDPADIASKNLFYGSGGKSHQPRGPFHFIEEDRDGTNPKFVVRDRDGTKWKVKLGVEARPETAASRLVWAAGYFTEEDYFLPKITVQAMPRLHRGQNLVAPDGSILNVRLKREPGGRKKLGYWRWNSNPFGGTRELNGLKTLMALLNNWDLKDDNNAIREEGDKLVYLVSDLGASFGGGTLRFHDWRAKGNLEAYERSRLFRKVHTRTVDFLSPAFPDWIYIFNPPIFVRSLRLEKLGRNIPRSDARWLGRLLSRLSQRQIQDAFRAAGFSPAEVEDYSKVVAGRIAQLSDL